jgi:hypothetical protein
VLASEVVVMTEIREMADAAVFDPRCAREEILARFAIAVLDALDEAQRIAAYRRWIMSAIDEIRSLIARNMAKETT